MLKYRTVEEWLADNPQPKKPAPPPAPEKKPAAPNPEALAALEECQQLAMRLRNITVHEIITMVAQAHGFDYQDIIDQDNRAPVKEARKAAMRAARLIRPDLTNTELGAAFKRHHTAISSACKEEA